MQQKLKSITIIASDYPTDGYMEYVFVQQLVHAIIELGVNITVVAPQSLIHKIVHKKKVLPKHRQGVTETGKVYDIYRPYTLSFGNKEYFKSFTSWYNKRSILSIIRKVKTEVLYSHFWCNALPVYEYAVKNSYPLFVACGEGDDALENMVKTMSGDEIKRLASSVTGVISVSSENKRKCISFGLAREKDIKIFPNCVNTSIFHPMDVDDQKKELGINEDDFVIAFVGMFSSRKGPDRVAQAIKNLNDSHIKTMFIGKPFAGYAFDFDCPGIIHKGSLNHEILPVYLNCADIFVLPTQKEGCCNAIVEALAIGLPVISSDRPFNDDILDENNSIRIDPDDVDAITNAIKALKENCALRHKMAEYSSSRHAEYSIEGRARKIHEFIKQQTTKSK